MATSTLDLLPIFPEEPWVPEWIRIRVDGQIRFEYAYAWTWKFLKPEKKKVADSKISGYVSYNSRFYSRLYVGIIKLNLKGQIPLRPTLGKQNLQAKEVHVLKNPCVGTCFFKSGKKRFLEFWASYWQFRLRRFLIRFFHFHEGDIVIDYQQSKIDKLGFGS